MNTEEQATDVQKGLRGTVRMPGPGEAVRLDEMEQLLLTETPGFLYLVQSLIYVASRYRPESDLQPLLFVCAPEISALKQTLSDRTGLSRFDILTVFSGCLTSVLFSFLTRRES